MFHTNVGDADKRGDQQIAEILANPEVKAALKEYMGNFTEKAIARLDAQDKVLQQILEQNGKLREDLGHLVPDGLNDRQQPSMQGNHGRDPYDTLPD